jgi:DNA-binding MarR family transcriptional regulator
MEARTIYLIKRVESKIQEQMAAALIAFELTPLQYTVMTFVEDKGVHFSSAQLSRRFLMTPQSMNEIVTILERKELLIKTKDPSNKRILLLSLTKNGKAILEKCNALINNLEKELFANLDETELKLYRMLMRKILESE